MASRATRADGQVPVENLGHDDGGGGGGGGGGGDDDDDDDDKQLTCTLMDAAQKMENCSKHRKVCIFDNKSYEN